MTYGSDATPALVSTTVTGEVGDRKLVRIAAEGSDFLVERAFFLTTTPSGERRMGTYFVDPTPLSDGKVAWNEFAAMVNFFPSLRMLGHTGIIVAHGCFDRALQASLARKMQQRQNLYYLAVGGPAPRTGDIALQELCDWHLSTGCAAHDSHNALKYGMGWLGYDSLDVLKRLFIVIASLRNGYDLLLTGARDRCIGRRAEGRGVAFAGGEAATVG
jgi:hypothetical protein